MVRKKFIYLLIDTPTGKVYYRSTTGTILLAPITAGQVDITLKSAPANWLDGTLEFQRNNNYWGIIRTYSTPMDFVKDAAQMINEIVLTGVGAEEELTIATYIYNSQPQIGEPTFLLYSKGNLDLNNLVCTLLEGLSVDMKEGGVSELYKAHESTPLEIPMDGSLPEHFKINCDGYYKSETYFYKITPVSRNGYNASFVPVSYLNNLGESFGIVKGEPILATVPDDAGMLESSNYLIYSTSAVKVRLKGYIVVRAGDVDEGNEFALYYRNQYVGSINYIITQRVVFNQARYEFDIEIDLQPYEKLFLVFFFFARTGEDIEAIVDGELSMSFHTKPNDSRPWAMSAYDLWKNIGKQICQIASQTGNPVSYAFESDLLAEKLNIAITPGDALRASNDPTYQRYFTLNENQQTNFGPLLKTTLKQFFNSLRVPLMSSTTMDHDSNGLEQLVFTSLENVYNATAVTFSLGEVSSLKWNWSKQFRFTDLEIGYPAQTYDQVSGKYETHTTLKMKAPIKKGEQQVLRLVSDYRTDVTGIEKLRTPKESGDSTSTTRNDSDNSVFMIDVDRSNYIMDYFRTLFVSPVFNPSDPARTNIFFETTRLYQKFDHPITDGGYFNVNKDFGIFVFRENGYSATESTTINISGVLNSVNALPGAPTDFVKIKFWRNGVVIKEYLTTVTGVNTPITNVETFSQAYAASDCIYITAETSPFAEVTINSINLTIGAYVAMSGVNIPVGGGTPLKVLSMPTVTPTDTDRVEYNYQYFQYNSNSYFNNFDLQLGVNGYRQGSTSETFVFNIYINGVQQVNYIVIPGTTTQTQFAVAGALINRNFVAGDIVFVTGSTTADVLTELATSTLTFTNTQVVAYKLYRELYTTLQGIPNFAADTISAGAPYNLRFSPMTCLINQRKLINSCFHLNVTGPLKNQGLDKNSFLLRIKDGEIIQENSDFNLLEGDRFVYPIDVKVETKVPIPFAQLCSATINIHVHFSFMGKDFYAFANKLSQKAALNDSQTWDMVLSPRTDLNNLADIFTFKVPDMEDNSIYVSSSAPIQWVPYNRVFNDKYHTRNRDESLFREQLVTWSEKIDYAAPVQIGDPLQLPFFTKGLSPLEYRVFRCDGTPYLGPVSLDTVASPAIVSPITNWQKTIDTTDWARGHYFLVVYGAGQPMAISEKLFVAPKAEMEGTFYTEYWNSFNTQGLVFDGVSPNRLAKRFWGGYSHSFKQKYIAKFYNDAGMDASLIHAIPYEEGELFAGRYHGQPDYESKKLLRILLMDQTKIDGEGFTIADGAEMESVVLHGVPMKYQKIRIRPTLNRSGINITAEGASTESSLAVTINAQTIGPNVTNQSGTTDNMLLELTLNNP